jgi:hypothetical protein
MAKDQYPVIIVADDALDLPEQLGTKEKYWLKDGQGLFKIGRLNTGENWAEKVAAELCGLLHLPHANYELATFKQQKGVLSQTIVPINGQLEMGNQLLAEIHSNYPSHERYKVTDHTFGRIHHYLQSKEILLPLDWEPPGTEIKTAFDALQQQADVVIVEGAGGFRVPINREQTMADLAIQLNLPVIMVVGIRLGCINHALMTAGSIKATGLNLVGWVANRVDPNMPAIEENIATLKAMIKVPFIADVAWDVAPKFSGI